MFSSNKQKQLRERQEREATERFDRNKRSGGDIYERIATLHEKPNPTEVAYAVLALLKEAQHLEALIRQSIKDRTHYDFDIGPSDGDLATYLGENIAYALRDHVMGRPFALKSGRPRQPLEIALPTKKQKL